MHTLVALVPWIIAHGYLLFFVVAVLEGSLVTTAAGIVAALGYFNIFIVIAISIAGDLVGDVAYYAIGYYGQNLIKTRFARFFGFGEYRATELKNLLHGHARKALLFIKLSPLVGPPGLITVGAVGVPFKKFVKITFVISAIKSIFFALIGFYSGKTYVGLSKFIVHSEYIVLGLALFIILVYFVYRKITLSMTNRIEDSE